MGKTKELQSTREFLKLELGLIGIIKQKRIVALRTGDLVLVGGKVRQVLNDYPSANVVDLAYLGGPLLLGGELIQFDDAPYCIKAERITVNALEAAGAKEVDGPLLAEILGG